MGAPIALIGKADEPLPDDATLSRQTSAAIQQAERQRTAQRERDASERGRRTAVAEPHAQRQQQTARGRASRPAGASSSAQWRATSPPSIISTSTQIAGTGPSGRIIRDDVQAYLANPQAAT